jgi:hypothetical protein
MTPLVTAEPQVLASGGWSSRNQRWLSRRSAFWRECLDRSAADVAGPFVPPHQEDEGFEPAAFRLRTLFGLSTFEAELVVLAAGIELDPALRRAVAEAQGMSTRDAVRLSFSLALGLLPEPHWDAVSPLGPLRHWSLVEFDASPGFAHALVRVEERVLHYLTGVAALDEHLSGVVRLGDVPAPALTSALDAHVLPMAAALAGAREPLVMLADALSDASRRRTAHDIAEAVFARAGLRTLWVDAARLGGDPRDVVDLARRADREAALLSAGIALALDPDGSANVQIVRVIEALRSPIITLGSLSAPQIAELSRRQVRRFDLPAPERFVVRTDLAPDVRRIVEQALQQFHVEPAALDHVLDEALAAEDGFEMEQRVWSGLRAAARGGLDALAQRIDSHTTLADLVVPPSVAAQLEEIASQLEQRRRVHEEWGFGDRQARGLGIAALFAGESGTGKTLAAEAIANAARLDLYRIDLASVVNKYIGETEKNLARLFDAAERSGAVLLFDEADALFGKRSEVKDSHDRYANIEVAYLLQRIETYRGLAILTTNMRSALDRAFLRRIRFIVQFPFPDEAARERIWRLQLPPRAPIGPIDFGALARLQLSGGHIRAVALNAAFAAARRGGPIEQQDLMAAARAEFAKLERTFNPMSGGGA